MFGFGKKEMWKAKVQFKPELVQLMDEYFGDKAQELLDQEAERLGISSMITANVIRKQEFVENLVNDCFTPLLSGKRLEVMKLRILSILNLQIEKVHKFATAPTQINVTGDQK